VVWARERTIPTGRPPLVGEVSANFCCRGSHVVSVTDPYGRILGFLDRSRYFFFSFFIHTDAWTSIPIVRFFFFFFFKCSHSIESFGHQWSVWPWTLTVLDAGIKITQVTQTVFWERNIYCFILRSVLTIWLLFIWNRAFRGRMAERRFINQYNFHVCMHRTRKLVCTLFSFWYIKRWRL
jgi:hypothetical protein